MKILSLIIKHWTMYHSAKKNGKEKSNKFAWWWNADRRLYISWKRKLESRSFDIRFDKSIFAQFHRAESTCILIKSTIQSNEDVSTILRFCRLPGQRWPLDKHRFRFDHNFVDFAGQLSPINIGGKKRISRRLAWWKCSIISVDN